MHSYDPRDWIGWGRRNRQPTDPNRDSLLRFGLLVATALCLASFLPREAAPAAFAHLMWIGALVTAVAAALTEAPPTAPHLTRWDEAAAALFLAIGTDLLFVDAPAGT